MSIYGLMMSVKHRYLNFKYSVMLIIKKLVLYVGPANLHHFISNQQIDGILRILKRDTHFQFFDL